jgi:hypothetical protein
MYDGVGVILADLWFMTQLLWCTLNFEVGIDAELFNVDR